MNNVLCIGELLIDFICSDIDTELSNGENFKKKAGGAPANVTATISKLGGKASFVGKVGADSFGVFLKKTLDDVNVDTSMMLLDTKAPTTLAFVSLKADGERDFVFNRGADEKLNYSELDTEKIFSNKIIHFGSATALLGGQMKETYLSIMSGSKEREIFISFDPNYRDNLWKNNESEFISISRKCIEQADFVKLSEEELKLISGLEDINDGIKSLNKSQDKIICVTLGKDGTMVSDGKQFEIVKSIKIKSVDSTGAGDAFIGAVLYKLSLLDGPKEVINSIEKLKDIVYFANKVGALVCTKLGAIQAIPTINEVEES